ncbi:MAG: hypothetical protein HN673_06520 [Rhodospirillales bacterium]|nr:hypothetical protein [Rhodospirillales bacterium]
MALYGFDWIAFSNDDAANYALAAQRFLHHGYFETPDYVTYADGLDYSIANGIFYILLNIRPGSELMLASLWNFSGLNAHQVYMPLMVALHMCLVSSTAAMSATISRNWMVPFFAAGLVAISPSLTLGTMYQLAPQVGGLALLVASVALLLRTPPKLPLKAMVSSIIPVTFLISAVLIWYVEMLPFLGLGWLIYLISNSWRDRTNAVRILYPALIIGITSILILNFYIYDALEFMFRNVGVGLGETNIGTSLFPFYLTPMGLATVWGLFPVGKNIPEPYMSVGIFIGIALSVWLIWGMLTTKIRSKPCAIILFIMIALAANMYNGNASYGLFKLAMVAQPFLLTMLVLRIPTARYTVLLSALIFAPPIISNVYSQYYYMTESKGFKYGGFVGLPNASSVEANQQFVKLISPAKEKIKNGILLDTINPVLARYQMLYLKGISSLFPARNYWDQVNVSTPNNINDQVFKNIEVVVGGKKNTFWLHKGLKDKLKELPIVVNKQSSNILNRHTQDANVKNFFQLTDSNALTNHLVFIHSSLGNYYYLGDQRRIGLYQLENDPMIPGRTMSGLGRYLQLMVVSPSKTLRVKMEISTTLMKHFDSRLPVPSLYAKSIQKIKFKGRGSARVFSDPITPLYINGVPVIAIDMGRKPERFPSRAIGLMRLYGTTVNRDPRLLTAFGRDISLVSEEKYRNFSPPSNLVNFPQGLENSELEYSGIYEDGYISEESFFILRQPSSTKKFKIEGLIPYIDQDTFKTIMILRIDGVDIVKKELGLGKFLVEIPVMPSQSSNRRVEISFSRAQKLPGADARISAAKINFLGFN